ncbi:DUF1553 domain-containing protein [Larkinella punicea]|uniref:DUF1553 domain-containing protein n=1 Tax=Larkinella punicea TaxID=2315727 RepID=A0A368JKB2_9BACT|nr:DUF1553 domain-containing protein [Larkinella punicea]RCR68088.1 DUF1553 domain-containing protein [Larkinella punicea]
MNTKVIVVSGAVVGVGLLLSSFLGWFEERVDFNTQVKPLLNKNCIACHGGVKKAGGFSVLFRHEAVAPTKSGKPAIVPGDADASEMIRRLTLTDHDDRMPLDAPPLKPEEIETLRNWIDQGAEWGDHWAYTRIEKPEIPQIGTFWSRLGLAKNDETNWVKNEIDPFILEKLRGQSLKPSPETDRATLIRRVSLDLTGLPPTQQEVADFVKDQSPNAYEKVVDRLLASPAYGERWTALWLDLARYADSKGYEKDTERKIWRYRDWVIKAFNQDMPYNQFTIEQLAGDLLPNPTDDQFIATGFHRNTMTNDEGGTQDEEFRVAAVLDRVNTTWDVFQGTTFACVQCHSHPYDPFVHDEYYKYLAFFNNTRDEDVQTDTPTLRFFKDQDSVKVAELKNWVASHTKQPQPVQELVNFVRLTEPKINSHDFDQYVNASLLDAKFFGVQHGGSARIKNVNLNGTNRLIMAIGTNAEKAVLTLHQDSPTGPTLLTIPVPKTGSQWRDTVMIYPMPTVSGRHHVYLTMDSPKQPKDWTMIKWVSFRPALPGTSATVLGEIDHKLQAVLNAKPESTPVLFEGKGDFARKTHVFDRGNWLVKGKPVQADVPKSLPPLPTDSNGKPVPRNRLGLALWMVNRDHPLTARVAVNRFWEQLFGTGLAETVEDMGTQGIPPTHRELLDYLATEFMETDHWSVKRLLKRMVTSATYRQRSEASADLVAKDPFNRWLARGPRVRLTAEQVRDQALATSGLLSSKRFGPSVKPSQPEGIWQSPYNGESWKLSEGEDRHRRALYTYWKRTSPYPSMITFDSPSREFCQVRRIRTNTPLQALVTLNDPVFVESAQTLAAMMQKHGKTADQQIQAGFRQVMQRNPAPQKLAVLVKLYQKAETYYQQHPIDAQKLLAQKDATPQLAALTITANTMLNLDEVITKE